MLNQVCYNIHNFLEFYKMKISGIIILNLFVIMLLSGLGYANSTMSRGVWIDKSQLHQEKKELYRQFQELIDANFNTFYINTQYKGTVPYPKSRYLPQDPDLEGKDIFPEMIKYLHSEGEWVEAWPEYGFYSFHVNSATKAESHGVVLDEHPDWAAIDRDGNNYLHNEKWGDFYTLCPANPEVHEWLTGLYCEIITNYNFDGINLDRMRFPTDDYCYCPYCKKRFFSDTGINLQDVKKGFPEYEKFSDWKKKQLTGFIKKLSYKLRETRPGIIITAAVVSPDLIDEKSQDWPLWSKNGYLDAVAPMLYSNTPNKAAEEVRNLVEPDFYIFYGFSAEFSTEKFLRNISLLPKNYPYDGITVWYAGHVMDDLEALAEGPFKEKCDPPFKK